MHDSVRLENSGIPTVPIATDVFRSAARAQASALGRADLDAVYVPHPIQDQLQEEIEERATAVLDTIVDRLTAATETASPAA
ncbi:MAG: hypothetical protein OXB91_11855 [Bryobacterales bacterium]|nr:hypothetical protein [Bryobacterales bacterium]